MISFTCTQGIGRRVVVPSRLTSSYTYFGFGSVDPGVSWDS